MKLNKGLLILGAVAMVAVALTGCKANAEELIVDEGIPVEVMRVEEVSRQVALQYKGTVVPEDQLTYAFKSGGRIESLNVKPGDEVKIGDVLATLENKDLSLQLNTASAKLASAQKDVKKAQESWLFNKDQLDNMKELYASGGISKTQLDQTQLSYDISESALEQARQGVRAAQAGFELNNRLLDDAVLIAKADGIVLSTPVEEGELLGAQEAVVMVQSATQVVQVGVSESDIDDITMETEVTIDENDMVFTGNIVEINNAPDMATRTYLVKTRVNEEGLRIGAIIDVSFATGNEKGIWVPAQAVMSDGEKFVYVIEDDRAFKRTVTIEAVNGFELQIKGVENGSTIVISGMKKLTDGVEVTIAN
jgi:RND family efflux transporter MFP subunit